MGCPVVCGRRDKEFIIASVSKRYQNLEKKSLFFFVVGVGVLVASHFDTKIRCERFSKIEDKRESLTNTWTCVMFIALILFLSVRCLSLSLSLSLSVCVCVCVCVCVLFYVCCPAAIGCEQEDASRTVDRRFVQSSRGLRQCQTS